MYVHTNRGTPANTHVLPHPSLRDTFPKGKAHYRRDRLDGPSVSTSRSGISSTCGGFHPTESDFFDEHFREKMIVPRVFADGEDTHSLRLKSELFDLRSGYANRFPCASHAETRCEMGVAPSDTPKKEKHSLLKERKRHKKTKAPRG